MGRNVAVVGEGELALRSAAELATFASQVILVCKHGEMLSHPLGYKLQKAKNVRILDGYMVRAILGDGPAGEGFARAVLLQNSSGSEEEIPVDGVFVERGLVPNSEMVAHLVNTDPAGRIRIDAANCTSAPGIFAAGDVTDLYTEQVLVAVGEGVKAALSAYNYLLIND